MESQTIHERFLMLKDVALGSVEEGNLVRLGYDCVLDSLLAVYHECQKSTSLSKDKYISRFLKKCKCSRTYVTVLYIAHENKKIKSFLCKFSPKANGLT